MSIHTYQRYLIYLFFMVTIWFKSLFARVLPALLASSLILVWALQNMGSHNGLDDKMCNILIMIATMYLFYGLTKPKEFVIDNNQSLIAK